MNFNMELIGFTDVIITKMEKISDAIIFYIELPKKSQICPSCSNLTTKIHDYRIQKIKHLKCFERLTILYYKRRRYSCSCGKRFSEKNTFLNRYQRASKEWNQTIQILSIKKKTFKEAAEVLGTSSTTVIRRFKKVAEPVQLPKAIAIDEYKGDTYAGKYQLIIANADTHKPIDILPNRRKSTIKHYLHCLLDADWTSRATRT